MDWHNLDEITIAIVDTGLNIMLHKGYDWHRVWHFLIHETECKNILLAQSSIYCEYISRGGEDVRDDDDYTYDSE